MTHLTHALQTIVALLKGGPFGPHPLVMHHHLHKG